MQYLGLLFNLALLGVNLWGMALVAGIFWRNRWFALAVGPLLAVTAMYAIECLHGLGPSLKVLGVLGTALSASLIALSASRWEPSGSAVRWTALLRAWRTEFAPLNLRAPFAVFGAIFLYAFLWRFSFPEIDGSSDKIPDLAFICSYLTGATIPVPDAWLYPYPLSGYYSFQYYGAALMGRILILSPGTTYNIAFCLLVGLVGSAFSGAVILATSRKWVRALIIAAFLIGGTGASLIVHATDRNVSPWSTAWFIGNGQLDKPPVGTWLKDQQDAFYAREMARLPIAERRLNLPSQFFAYVVFVGDFHPPLSGYYLMGICAMAVLLWEREGRRRYAAIAGGTLTWTLLANTWVLPLQALALLAWLAISWRKWRRLVPAFLAGAAIVWLAAWPFLSVFTASASGHGSFRMVPSGSHTPPIVFALFFLPTLALIALGFLSGKAVGRWLGALWLFLLLFTEFFYFKDLYSGPFERFNTTLKWWPWVLAGSLMTLGPVVLDGSRRRWVRVAGILFCLYPCFYILDLWNPLHERLEDGNKLMGKLDGAQLLNRDESDRLMLERLRLEKPGVVVERPVKKDGRSDAAVLPLFAGHRMWMGSLLHVAFWHGDTADIDRRYDHLALLYGGGMPEAGKWLLSQGIDYVLWYRPEDTAALWEKINASVQPEYIWYDIVTDPGQGGRRVGLWMRNPRPARSGPSLFPWNPAPRHP